MNKELKKQEIEENKIKLRLWLLNNYNQMNDYGQSFFQLWKWLEEGLEKDDTYLRKICLTCSYGMFKHPQEALEWINTGVIPSHLKQYA